MMSVRQVTAKRLLASVKGIDAVSVGNFEYSQFKMSLGDLKVGEGDLEVGGG